MRSAAFVYFTSVWVMGCRGVWGEAFEEAETVRREWGIGVGKRTSEEGGGDGDCLVLGVKLERVLSEEVGDDEAKVKKLMVVWLFGCFFRF